MTSVVKESSNYVVCSKRKQVVSMGDSVVVSIEKQVVRTGGNQGRREQSEKYFEEPMFVLPYILMTVN